MLHHGSKTHLQISQTTIQQQTPAEKASLGDNSSICNISRKSSETVTSSSEGQPQEEALEVLTEAKKIDSTAEAAKALADALGEDEEETETASENASPRTEIIQEVASDAQPQPSLSESSQNETTIVEEKLSEDISSDKNEEDSLNVKKVRKSLVDLRNF